MNFINLNQESEPKNINIKQIQLNAPKEDVKDIVLHPIDLTIETEQNESEGCIQQKVPDLHACTQKYFAIENLFSELTDDYQRSIIRQNLGITGKDSMLWGNIEGNLANQKDLYKLVQDLTKQNNKNILDNLNFELKYWTQQIENKIESLASNISSLQIVPRYAIPNQLPVDVVVQWEYEYPVEAQTINGVAIPVDQREFVFENVNDSLPIRLAYYYNGVWLARNINFEVEFPIFYGTSEDFTEDNYTIQNKFTVTANEGEYIYVISKNVIDLSVNGLIGGFDQIGFTNIASSRYIIYKSYNPSLGETLIRVHDKE